jgi:hypothetical protein
MHDIPDEITDSGVKFASWGRTADRFYTGSSDGKVKAWDIRKPKGNAFVRTVLSVSGGITAGAFSNNFSQLLIGDATGKVHLLGVDEDSDEKSEQSRPDSLSISGVSGSDNLDPNGSGTCSTASKSVPRQTSAILAKGSNILIANPEDRHAPTVLAKKPKLLIAHPEPPPPAEFGLDDEDEDEGITARDLARQYLEEGQLKMHPDPAIGAVQGPNYMETSFFLKEAHENNDPTLPLLPEYQVKQRYQIQSQEERLELPCLPEVTSSDRSLHEKNMSLDLDFSRLALSTQEELVRDGVDLDFEPAHDFDFELCPRFSVFKEHKKQQKRINNF